MEHIAFAADFITANNQQNIARTYRNKDFTRSTQTSASIEPGNVIVTRRVTLRDPFDALCFVRVHEDFWICTRDEFDRTFDIISNEPDNIFVLIRPK